MYNDEYDFKICNIYESRLLSLWIMILLLQSNNQAAPNMDIGR